MFDSLSVIASSRLTARDYKTLWLATLGGVLEFYDFIIFVFFANTIDNLFFPPGIPDWVRQFQTFGIFAAGYLARPLGGVVMAHAGDLRGRKQMFTLSVFLMALPTLGAAHFRHRVAADLRLLGCVGASLVVAPAHPARSGRWWRGSWCLGLRQRACAPVTGRVGVRRLDRRSYRRNSAGIIGGHRSEHADAAGTAYRIWMEASLPTGRRLWVNVDVPSLLVNRNAGF